MFASEFEYLCLLDLEFRCWLELMFASVFASVFEYLSLSEPEL